MTNAPFLIDFDVISRQTPLNPSGLALGELLLWLEWDMLQAASA